MRIPNYEKQIGYQRAFAKPVQLTPPTLDTSRSKQWDKWAAVAGITKTALPSLGVGLELADRYRGMLNRGEILFDTPEEKQSQRLTGKNSAEQTHGFSSSKRQDLLDFARQHINQPKNLAYLAEPYGLTDRLDSYVADQFVPKISNENLENPDKNLWLQDYVILRRELEHQQQKKMLYEQEQQFEQGAGNFIQISALIRSPLALEKYINSNLSSAEKEYIASEFSANQWPVVKQNLTVLAVKHNLEAALQTGEIEQAQQVYHYFKPRLSSDEQISMEKKLSYFRTEQSVDKIYQEACAQCINEEEIDETKLNHFIEQKAPREQVPSSMLGDSLRVRLQAEIQRKNEQKAGLCRTFLDCIASKKDATQTDAIKMPEQDELFQWYIEGKSHTTALSNPAIFNSLYKQINEGELKQKHIISAYQASAISATDALRLTEHLSSVKSHSTDCRESILCGAIENLSLQYHLTEQEREQAQYFVLSAGYDFKSRLSAAKELKEILTLQEKRK